MVGGMIVSYECDNHLRSVHGVHGIHRFESRGRTETLVIKAALVACGGEGVAADEEIRVSFDSLGCGTLRFELSDAPRPLRDALRGAMPSASVMAFAEMRWPRGAPFTIHDDGARCDIDPSTLTITEASLVDAGPVTLALVGENVRALIPGPVKPA